MASGGFALLFGVGGDSSPAKAFDGATMLVMRWVITDQFLMSHSHAAVGSCGKVGWPHHYLSRG